MCVEYPGLRIHQCHHPLLTVIIGINTGGRCALFGRISQYKTWMRVRLFHP